MEETSIDNLNAVNAESDLTQSLLGFDVMSTKNIREQIFNSEAADSVEGVSGRWTMFTQLHRADRQEPKLAINVFAIDSKEEIKVGIGRLFKSKKVIGERQAIVSDKNLKALDAQVGDNMTVFYDMQLMLNMFSSMTGQIVPSFFTKGATKEEL